MVVFPKAWLMISSLIAEMVLMSHRTILQLLVNMDRRDAILAILVVLVGPRNAGMIWMTTDT
jgi:hypothetical protein